MADPPKGEHDRWVKRHKSWLWISPRLAFLRSESSDPFWINKRADPRKRAQGNTRVLLRLHRTVNWNRGGFSSGEDELWEHPVPRKGKARRQGRPRPRAGTDRIRTFLCRCCVQSLNSLLWMVASEKQAVQQRAKPIASHVRKMNGFRCWSFSGSVMLLRSVAWRPRVWYTGMFGST